jgi:hypothetical protein
MRTRHSYLGFSITLETEEMGDGKWCCRALIDGSDALNPPEVRGDRRDAVETQALNAAKDKIDRHLEICRTLLGKN